MHARPYFLLLILAGAACGKSSAAAPEPAKSAPAAAPAAAACSSFQYATCSDYPGKDRASIEAICNKNNALTFEPKPCPDTWVGSCKMPDGELVRYYPGEKDDFAHFDAEKARKQCGFEKGSFVAREAAR